MKILYIVTKSNLGGAQRYVLNLATLLKEKHQITVALGGNGELREKLKNAGIEVRQIAGMQRDANPLKDLEAFASLLRIIRAERPDVIHLNSSKAGGLGGLAGRVAGSAKIIFTGHGWAFNEDRNLLSRAVIALLHWVTILLSHTVIAVSEKTASQIRVFPFAQRKVRVIRSGIASPDFLSMEEARKRLSEHSSGLKSAALDKESIWIGTASELHCNKGLDTAIEAFDTLKDTFPKAIFCIMGEGEERQRLETLIATKKLTERVFLAGFVPNASSHLKASDIFSLSSRTEALPYALLEAGAANTASVASKVGGIPEIIEDGRTGILVPPRDSAQLALAYEKLLKNTELRFAFGKATAERIRTEFGVERMVRETEELYGILK